VKLSTRHLALVAVFAALYYVLSLVSPKIPSIGLPDIKIQLEALIASVFGFVLGPYLGALSAFMGAFVSWVLPPVSMSPTGIPFLLSPPLNALCVGLIFYRKWKWAFTLFGLLILVFLFLPPSQPLSSFYFVPVAVVWDKVIALLLIVPLVFFGQKLGRKQLIPVLFFVVCFIGNQVDNMWGADAFALPIVYNGIFSTSLEGVRIAFVISPFIYPAIRLIQATVGMAIATPLMAALKNTRWIVHEKSIIEQ
jgi:uncharacterized membrane protein